VARWYRPEVTAVWIVAAVAVVLALVLGSVLAYRRGVASGRRAGDPFSHGPAELRATAIRLPVAAPETATNLIEVVRARLAAGRKIQAVKEIRSMTGLGLREAKELVEDVDAGRALPPWLGTPMESSTPAGASVDSGPALAEVGAVARRMRDRNGPIEAMKYVHEQTGMSLAEAKDYVDGLK
jgi:ribosomal protein L7/L12